MHMISSVVGWILNRGLFWLHMYLICSDLKEPGTPWKVVPYLMNGVEREYQLQTDIQQAHGV